jgi:acetoin utilization deacetylase AcuC-like enzyme
MAEVVMGGDEGKDGGEQAGEGTLPFVWAPEYLVDIGPHVFPTVKYEKIKEVLLSEGTLRSVDLHRPEPAPPSSLARAHTSDYVEKVMTGRFSPADEARLELPFSRELRQAYLLCCGGTTLAGRLALETGRAAVHIGGGFHHAFADHGEGFCLLNDVAVGVHELRAEGRVGRVAVVDLDLHHGNGTAAIFRDEPEVFTFSMHEEQNYPLVKPPSDLDVGLEFGVGDETYLDLLEENLSRVLDDHAPELVYYLAGADPFREDQLGGLRLTLEGLRARDRMVLRMCRDREIPVATLTAGGYARRLADTVEIHCGTIREARALFE